MSYKGHLSRLTRFFKSNKKISLSVFSVVSVVGLATGVLEIRVFIAFCTGVVIGVVGASKDEDKKNRKSKENSETYSFDRREVRSFLEDPNQNISACQFPHKKTKYWNVLHVMATSEIKTRDTYIQLLLKKVKTVDNLKSMMRQQDKDGKIPTQIAGDIGNIEQFHKMILMTEGYMRHFSNLQAELLSDKSGIKKNYGKERYNFLHIIAICNDLNDLENSEKYAAIVRRYSSAEIETAMSQRLRGASNDTLTPSELAERFYGSTHQAFFDQWIGRLLTEIKRSEATALSDSGDFWNHKPIEGDWTAAEGFGAMDDDGQSDFGFADSVPTTVFTLR